MISILKSSITNAVVTKTYKKCVDDCIQIDEDLMVAAGLRRYEQVRIINVTTGAQFVTYVTSSNMSRKICLNGVAALYGEVGDALNISGYEYVSSVVENHKPIFIDLDEEKAIKKSYSRE